jgi:hypothetical protein
MNQRVLQGLIGQKVGENMAGVSERAANSEHYELAITITRGYG